MVARHAIAMTVLLSTLRPARASITAAERVAHFLLQLGQGCIFLRFIMVKIRGAFMEIIRKSHESPMEFP